MIKYLKYSLLILLLVSCTRKEQILLEAENFEERGGWVIDNQSATVMGSPYLLAHGLGVPVKDAETSFEISKDGIYRMWVRTKDWTRAWGRDESPGRFEVWMDDTAIGVFGTEESEWYWQDGGTLPLSAGTHSLKLHDLTGFEGRCDAIYLTTDINQLPPNDLKKMHTFRRKALGITDPIDQGSYDLVVVGGGIAGCCAAVSAARLGCKVALIQNRPVLGGNNSSEVRVGLSGLISQQPYPNIGNLLDELGGVGHWTNYEARRDTASERSKQILTILKKHPEKIQHNAGPASNYEDEKKLQLIANEPNISLFLNTEVVEVRKKGNRISAVIGKDIQNGKESLFKGTLFVDCTGDGNLGYLAGADYRVGRESKSETQEASAPEQADQLTMGTSVQWYSEETDSPQAFPDCPWAIQFSDSTCFPIIRGDWQWEAGLMRDQIVDIEQIRDYALRAVYGNWSYVKNKWRDRSDFQNRRLVWAAYIGGKRESRRLLGDVVLTEQDILGNVPYEDASFTTTWGIDLHYPEQIPGLMEEPFTAISRTQSIAPYAVPYRCLYSRNIENLFMAGRDISVTHIALGTVRVMRTGGMMGEVVGMAASICKQHEVLPRAVYTDYLPELKNLMQKGVGKLGFPEANRMTIMGLGDSITEGGDFFTSYLQPLWKKLREAGLNVEFVGPRECKSPGERLYHCAFSGKTIEYLDEKIEDIYRSYPADVVLLHAGHNHFVEEKPIKGMIASYQHVIQTILKINPDARILLAKVIPSGKLPKYSYIPQLNEEIERLVKRINNGNVVVVDQEKGFDWSTMTVKDRVHPNEEGADHMASVWFEAIQKLTK